jgi:HPt (histidine-containing phosphotransfer) domain-containing protein
MTPERDTTQEDKIVVHIDADLQDLIPGYLANRHGDIHAMREALAQGDYETIRILGHSMKGSGGGYGFDAITEIGGSIEHAARDREPDTIRRWVGELLAYLERVQVLYD